jgi:hypothetical protein
MRRNKLDEAIALFDDNDSRSFDQIYGRDNPLFEDGIDDLISPRMRKLFEATYQTGNVQQKQLREGNDENCDQEECDDDLKESDESEQDGDQLEENNLAPGGHYDSGKGSPKPLGDGVPDGHNKAGMSGTDKSTRQSTPGFHTNKQLGSEPPKGGLMNESFEAIFKRANR